MSIAQVVKYASKSFTLPDTCMKLRKTLDDPKASLDDMAKIMSVDPSLCGKVLKLANSALFRFPTQIESVPKALNVIGGEAAYNISMAETANLAFTSLANSSINFDDFRHKAVLTGLIAKSLAQQKNIRGSERYFVIGILSHLSELVCSTKLPEKYRIYKETSNDSLRELHQIDVFGFTFSQCSGLILSEWQLPDAIVEPLKGFRLSPSVLQQFEMACIFVVSAMSQLGVGREILEHPQMPNVVFDTIGINDYEYDIIAEFAQAESAKVASALK